MVDLKNFYIQVKFHNLVKLLVGTRLCSVVSGYNYWKVLKKRLIFDLIKCYDQHIDESQITFKMQMIRQ